MSELARLLDPNELDRADGPRGRMVLDVPPVWLAAGDTVELEAPRRLACARCEGGGCDGCGRSGAIRPTIDVTARTIRFALPSTEKAGALVRLVRPLGDDAGLEQLSLEIRAAPEPSPGCRRVESAIARASPSIELPSVVVGVAIVVLIAIAVAVGLR